MVSENHMCLKCRFGDHKAMRCYNGGWETCNGKKFETEKEFEQSKQLKSIKERLKVVSRELAGAKDAIMANKAVRR